MQVKFGYGGIFGHPWLQQVFPCRKSVPRVPGMSFALIRAN